jgi:hypothetical protein
MERQESGENKGRDRLVGGVVLVLIGALLLIAQLTDLEQMGAFVPLALGVLFLTWGILTRTLGLLIPGGILSGIGVGVVLLTGPLGRLPEDSPQAAGLFLLCFAAGWGLITLLSAFFTEGTAWWALIPGGVLGLIGGALTAGGEALEALAFLNNVWPAGLILLGLYLILWRRSLTE